MNRTHAISGAAAGMAVAPLAGLHELAETVVFAVTAAGYAMLPDLDHRSSSVSRWLGPVTGLLSRALRWVSRVLYRWTKGPRDEPVSGDHRHFSHTLVFAGLAGGAAAWFGSTSPWTVAAVVLAGVLLAEDRLGDWVLLVAALAITVWAVGSHGNLAGALTGVSGAVGIAVALGCVTHSVGDGLTRAGVPLLWPIPIKGETWYELKFLGPLRFRTGGPAETLVFAACAGVIAWQAWPLVQAALPGPAVAGG